jgi:hypothetical protein
MGKIIPPDFGNDFVTFQKMVRLDFYKDKLL